MKRQTQTVGVRKWAGDDLVSLQSETLKALDAFFAEYGPCVIQGCEITVSADGGGTYDVAAGLVALTADDQQGAQRVMVMPFAGATGVALPLYLTAAVETITEAYGDGKVKPIAYVFTAQAVGADPGAEVPHLTLTETGGNRFVDVVQDENHRFISDNERAKWNAILQQAKEYADSVSATGSEAALRSAKEYTDQREVAILAAVDTRDAQTLKTAKAYADTIVAALAGTAPETLDTLQELAAALGNDPNFSATVMQMIGERVTTEAMNAALAKYLPLAGGNVTGNLTVGNKSVWHAGNFDPSKKVSVTTYKSNGTDLNQLNIIGSYSGEKFVNAPDQGWLFIVHLQYNDISNWKSQVAYSFGLYNNSNRIWHRSGMNNADWSPWVEILHSGNFDPSKKLTIAEGWAGDADTVDNLISKTFGATNMPYNYHPFLSFGGAGHKAQFNAMNNSLKFRSTNNTGELQKWVEVYHSGNLGAATASAAGLMSAADKAKLDAIPSGGMRLLGAGVYDGPGNQMVKKTGVVLSGTRAGGTGYFRITHNIGNTNYEVQATCSAEGGSNGYVSVRSKTATYFDVYTGDDDSPNDLRFFFQIYEFA